MLMQNTEGAAVVIIWGVLISTIDNNIIFPVEMCVCVCVCYVDMLSRKRYQSNHCWLHYTKCFDQ